MKEITEIKLVDIRIDGGTQSRVSINQLAVADYGDAMTWGATLPPVTLFFDGTEYWLTDGFHRYHAHCKIGMLNIDAEVINGTSKDAKLFAYGANKDHGLRGTTEDKRKAVAGMLDDFGDWSDSKIARHVGVDHKTVAAHRLPILGNSQDAPTTRTVERNGKTFEQNTANIGKTKTAAQSPDVDPTTGPEVTPQVSALAIDADPGMPADMVGYDLSQDVTSIEQLLADERRENAILQAQVEAFQETERDAELEKQIRIRFGIEQRLHQEMDKVGQLGKELRYIGKQFAELRKMTKADSSADVLAAVRALLKEVA